MTTFLGVLILSAAMFSAGVCIGAFLTWKKNRKEQRDIANYIKGLERRGPFPGSHDD